jgi:regulator of protease activity HflC (stomatin/prohibitin superfamily)
MNNKQQPIRVSKQQVTFGVLALVGFLLLVITTCSSIRVIEGGTRGVVTKLGTISSEPLGEGFHLVTPFITNVSVVNIRVQKSDVGATAGTKDLQKVAIKVVVNYSLDPARVVDIYRKVGTEEAVVTNIISPANQETIKASTAKLNAEELLTKREDLKMDIFEDLKARLSREGIVIHDASIADIDFSAEFDKAIEQKQIAQQAAQQAKYLAEKATNEAAAAIEQAKGVALAEIERAKGQAAAILEKAKADAEAQELLKRSLSKDILELRALEKWNGVLPIYSTSGSSVPFIQLQK